MITQYTYLKILQAKDGNLIPVCTSLDGDKEIAIQSKYNPIREAEVFASNIDTSSSFFVVLGLAGGYHIEKLIDKVPDSKIIVSEVSQTALTFLSQIPCVKKLSQDKRITFCSIENIDETILKLYKPAIHGNLTILSLRQWEEIFKNEAELIRKKITESIKLLAQDFSVQCHFGKIWQKNIISNLSIAEKSTRFSSILKNFSSISSEKTAAIIAAGPSLDEKITILKKERNKYFIIATDTAFSTLNKYKIQTDAVISIDGQNISHEHFLDKILPETLFFFDLCASSSAVRKVINKSKNLCFFETGHPLTQYASLFSGKRSFVHLNSGSGTVTIAAASLAKALKFEKIEFFGADFSYIQNRPYARGTYFETRFNSQSNRFLTSENKYTGIMYRTPVIKISENQITTEILSAYKNSLKEFMENKNQKYTEDLIDSGTFNFTNFKNFYLNELTNTFKNKNDIDESSYAFTTLLPLCAKLGKDSAFLAYLKTLRYTERV